jgi:hypothetical protein
MSWAEIASHLTRVMVETPPNHAIANKDPCALRYIRLREIGRFLKIHYSTICAIRRNERVLEDPKMQANLSWFFHAKLRGRITKEQAPDGEWHIVYRDPQSQAHTDEARPGPDPPSRPLPRVVLTREGVKLKFS